MPIPFRPPTSGNPLQAVLLLAVIACSACPSAYSQTPAADCPSSIMAAGAPFDLAGAIRQAGSAQALLANTEQALREMSADCSTFANAEECRVTKAVTRDVNSALKTCIAKASAQAKIPAPTQAPTTQTPGSSGIDPSLYQTQDNSDGNQIYRQMAAAGTPFVPKNPQKDYTGEPCVFFTQPLVRPDGGGLNAYADGAHAAFGKYYYVCRDRRWISIGLASSFTNNAQEHAAERQERSTLSTQIYEKE